MALLPLLIRSSQPALRRFPPVLDDVFEEAFLQPFFRLQAPQLPDVGLSRVVDDKDKFAVRLDVSDFKPEELSISLKDRQLTVEAKHEQRDEQGGFVQRHFVRTYQLPENVDLEAVRSQLDERHGSLLLEAPKKKQSEEAKRIKEVPIQRLDAVENNSKSTDQQ